MAASFPTSVKTFSAVVNGVTKLVAALFNSPNDEITAIETALGANLANIGFHSRTADSGVDKSDFTVDGAWHDWDMHLIVPVGAKAVLLRLVLQSQVTTDCISFRQNGTTPAASPSSFRTFKTDVAMQFDAIVPCDTGSIVEYYLNNGAAFDVKNATIGGWWF